MQSPRSRPQALRLDQDSNRVSLTVSDVGRSVVSAVLRRSAPIPQSAAARIVASAHFTAPRASRRGSAPGHAHDECLPKVGVLRDRVLRGFGVLFGPGLE